MVVGSPHMSCYTGAAFIFESEDSSGNLIEQVTFAPDIDKNCAFLGRSVSSSEVYEAIGANCISEIVPNSSIADNFSDEQSKVIYVCDPV